jgi:hypothetical protein
MITHLMVQKQLESHLEKSIPCSLCQNQFCLIKDFNRESHSNKR